MRPRQVRKLRFAVCNRDWTEQVVRIIHATGEYSLTDGKSSVGKAILALTAFLVGGSLLTDAACAAQATPAKAAEANPPAAPVKLDIDEYVIEGVDILPQKDVENAVYPFLGPGRNTSDVEKARAALERAYHDRGYQAVIVEIPPQNAENGIVRLKATEGKVGRLTVNGSKYFSPDLIKKRAASVKEGTVPNFNEIQKDLVALNQWPDRKVTPALRAGAAPGTIDVDLNVEDKFPLHGSVEFNNRQSPDTTQTRISTTLRYDNLWQLGHSVSFSYNVAPERPNDATSYSGSYLARVPGYDYLSFLLYGVKSTSDVTTVGGVNVVGPGDIIGTRLNYTLPNYTLPSKDALYHSISVGIDYKNFQQDTRLGGSKSSSPIEYYPVQASYAANFIGDGVKTDLNAGLTWGFRGLGSSPSAFDNKRYFASGDFFVFKGDVAQTRELAFGTQLYAKVRGQIGSVPLVSSEEFSAGGLDTVRGYLESEVLGDNAFGGTIEFRSPNLPTLFRQWMTEEKAGAPKGSAAATPANSSANESASLKTAETDWFGSTVQINEWRVYGFADRAYVSINQPLPEQTQSFDLASYGIGTRIKAFDYLNASLDYAVPLFSQVKTKEGDPRVLFRVWGEF